MIEIYELSPPDQTSISQVVTIMLEGFRMNTPGYINNERDAMEEINENFEDGRISLIAVDDDEIVLGYIGGRHDYAKAWELHPLVVAPQHHRRGIGSMLVEALEDNVREKGGVTLMLGTDDQTGQTSIHNVDLYPDVWKHIANIENLKDHAFGFYQKMGFTIIGLVPDANGIGEHDILMAKRL